MDSWITTIRARLARRLLGPFAEVTYSQEGEDRVLARMLGTQSSGFYVDIGSHHPTRYSNSYLFYRMGWRGIVVDPALAATDAFRRVRPRDIALGLAVGREPGRQTYYEFDEPALNTLSPERAELLMATTNYKLVRTSDVEVQRLGAILKRHLPDGQQIDFLSVDTEGMDEDVLASNDWGSFRPLIVVAEALGLPSIGNLDVAPIAVLVRAEGYRPVAVTGNSVVFVHGVAGADVVSS